jgi:HSP20 family molecular chaperone IbpA
MSYSVASRFKLFTSELPGIRKEDVHISVHKNMLTLMAERKRVHNEESWTVHHRELEFGKVYNKQYIIHIT